MSFNELAGSPKESMSESSGNSANRTFLVPYEIRVAFAEALVGTAYPHLAQTRINSLSIEPWNGADMPPSGTIIDPSFQSSDYPGKFALITLGYGPDFTKKVWPTEMPKPENIRFGSELRFRVSGSAQFLVLPFGGCKWADNGVTLKDGDNSRILIPIREIELQWDFVDDPPLDDLDDLMGTVNDSSFLGCEPETLLFENYSVQETFRASALNPHTNRVMIQMRRRRIKAGVDIYGWNHDYRESPVGWAKVLFKSDNEPRYKLKSFTNIFA
jgi:hypothetical protein